LLCACGRHLTEGRRFETIVGDDGVARGDGQLRRTGDVGLSGLGTPASSMGDAPGLSTTAAMQLWTRRKRHKLTSLRSISSIFCSVHWRRRLTVQRRPSWHGPSNTPCSAPLQSIQLLVSIPGKCSRRTIGSRDSEPVESAFIAAKFCWLYLKCKWTTLMKTDDLTLSTSCHQDHEHTFQPSSGRTWIAHTRTRPTLLRIVRSTAAGGDE